MKITTPKILLALGMLMCAGSAYAKESTVSNCRGGAIVHPTTDNTKGGDADDAEDDGDKPTSKIADTDPGFVKVTTSSVNQN